MANAGSGSVCMVQSAVCAGGTWERDLVRLGGFEELMLATGSRG
jgi:hypothetical protein